MNSGTSVVAQIIANEEAPKRTRLRIEADRSEEKCRACEKLQNWKPGGKCMDCQEARTWAKSQVKVEPDEVELKIVENRRLCRNDFCRQQLSQGRYQYCESCHARRIAGYSDQDTKFALVLPQLKLY